MVKPAAPPPSPTGVSGFNPSVGILGGQTLCFTPTAPIPTNFQSLSRDSWWSNLTQASGPANSAKVSIPQSGFLVVKLALLRERESRPVTVSIPQSGFLVVKPFDKVFETNDLIGFNPSVGILGGQTHHLRSGCTLPPMFQSLSRDSWWSNFQHGPGYIRAFGVSIPQSGFLVVKLS